MKAPFHIELDPNQRSDDAINLLLQHLLSIIRLNEAGVIANEDIECLHDFRIAVRKTRAVFGQFKRVFPDQTTEQFKPQWAWLGKITSEPRDLDIYLHQFDALKAELPAELQPALDPLHSFLHQRAAISHQTLNEWLRSDRYETMMTDWLELIQTSDFPHNRKAAKPIAQLAHRRIIKSYKTMVKQGLSIKTETPAEEIHELRKTAKKLRYLLDMFHGFYPKSKPFIKQLKDIQELLGKYQDTHIQIEKLKQYSQDMHQLEAIPQKTHKAIAATLHRLDTQQTPLKKEIKECFQAFAKTDHPMHFEKAPYFK